MYKLKPTTDIPHNGETGFMEALGHGDMTKRQQWLKEIWPSSCKVEGRRMHYEHNMLGTENQMPFIDKQMKIKTTPSTSPHEASIKKRPCKKQM